MFALPNDETGARVLRVLEEVLSSYAPGPGVEFGFFFLRRAGTTNLPCDLFMFPPLLLLPRDLGRADMVAAGTVGAARRRSLAWPGRRWGA